MPSQKITNGYLNSNGFNSYWIHKLIEHNIIKLEEDRRYSILNEKVFNMIIKREYDANLENEEMKRIVIKAYASQYYQLGIDERDKGFKADKEAETYKASCCYIRAVKYLKEYIKIMEEKANSKTFSGYYELGKTYVKLKNINEAKKAFLMADSIAKSKNNIWGSAKVKYQLAEMYINNGNVNEALLIYKDLINNKALYQLNLNEIKDINFKIKLCYNNSIPTLIKKDNEINNLVKNNNISELLAAARLLYENKEIKAADYVMKKACNLAKKYNDKNSNIEINDLQQHRKIYKILR